MHKDITAVNRRAEDIFEQVLSAVPEDRWDDPSACENWTIRDVAGHAVWGRELIRTGALGDELRDRTGAPGAAHPADFLVDEPPKAFRAARTACDAALTAEALDLPAPAFVRRNSPGATVGDFLANLVSELIVHAWDIESRIGVCVEVDDRTLAVAMGATARGVMRSDAFFADEVKAPVDANPFDTWLSFLGRHPQSNESE